MLCNLCPRRCNIDRNKSVGFCGMTDEIVVSKIMLHMWEEPPVSYKNGSGAIFFSGCSLRCVYCQNKEISHSPQGKVFSEKDLAEEMLKLQELGAHNINLVTPTHFSDKIRSCLDLIKGKLKIPIVYNTSGYELDEEIEKMRDYVDVFLTDIKYFTPEISKKYSSCPDYYKYAKSSFAKMLSICPEVIIEDGVIKKGVILRHLVLPSLRIESIKILEDIAKDFDVTKFNLSLMSQYTPEFCGIKYKELKRKITTFEYQSVLERAIELGFCGYMQEKTSATTKYTPNFKGDNI